MPGDEPFEVVEEIALPEAWAAPAQANDAAAAVVPRDARRSVLAFDYDAERRLLRIAWASGNAYELEDVPPAIHEGLAEARSRGRYFQEWIRDRFAYRRLP